VFPKEVDRATVMLLETAKRSPKAFGKLVVDSLVKNVVSKGVPILGAIAGFAPKEMGDATLDNSGFVEYKRLPPYVRDDIGQDTGDKMFARKIGQPTGTEEFFAQQN
jgi:hypothetical protein